jgi:hypothetical protein
LHIPLEEAEDEITFDREIPEEDTGNKKSTFDFLKASLKLSIRNCFPAIFETDDPQEGT